MSLWGNGMRRRVAREGPPGATGTGAILLPGGPASAHSTSHRISVAITTSAAA